MDCDDVMLHLAGDHARTLPAAEEVEYHEHLAECAACQALTQERREDWRWLARVPADALEGRTVDVMPTIDPIVFEVDDEIGAGGMGRILRAFDRRLGRDVAVKQALDPAVHDRFEREVRITARLQHPAIVSIYEAGTFLDGVPFYTMRLLPGRTLQDKIDEAPTLADRLRLMPHVRAIADAVGYAHARGVVHRDLKPGNVLVGEFGETVVIDWGLAKEGSGPESAGEADAQDAHPDLTLAGTVIGTPCFMSPEQARGEPADARDDVYALGAVLYTVLVGEAPYLDTAPHDSHAILDATRAGPPTPIAARASHAPRDLCAIAERAMARAKRDRFADAKELADELARFEAGQLLLSRSYTVRERLVRWIRKHRRSAALVGLAAIAAGVAAILWIRYERASEELAIRAHDTELTDLYADVARQANGIDRELLRLSHGLEGLATAAAWALTGPEPSGEDARFYFDHDFDVDKPEPKDVTKGTAYRWPVSVEFPVVGVAPGVDRTPLLPKIRRLAPLRRHIRDMVLEAAVPDISMLAPARATAMLRARESPIDYAYVDLPEGVHFVWPGMANLPADYDVRLSSFYVTSRNKHGTRCGPPYVDATTARSGDDLVLPCTRGLWSSTGEFLGVAGVEITVTKLVETRMAMTTRATLRSSLVDSSGRTLVDSRNARQLFRSSGRDDAVELVDFDLPDVANAIRMGLEGIRTVSRNGHTIVAAFVRLDSVRWYYVVEVDADTLGATR